MNRPLFRRGAVGLTAAALACAGLVAPSPVSAAVDYAEVAVDAYFYAGTDCTLNAGLAGPEDKPFLDNGVPVSHSFSTSRTATANGDPADKVTMTASSAFTASATPIGTGPSTIKGKGTVRATATPTLAASTCDAEAEAQAGAYLSFHLAKPMWAVVKGSGNGSKAGFGGLELYSEDTGAYFAIGQRASGTLSARLPAGDAGLSFRVSTAAESEPADERNVWYTGSFNVQLLPMGHPSAVAGKAKRYVKLGARDCTTAKVNGKLTKKVKKKATKAVVKVNGKKVASYKGKQLRKRTLRLPAPSASKANVVATVKLKSGATVKVSRSYLACS